MFPMCQTISSHGRQEDQDRLISMLRKAGLPACLPAVKALTGAPMFLSCTGTEVLHFNIYLASNFIVYLFRDANTAWLS